MTYGTHCHQKQVSASQNINFHFFGDILKHPNVAIMTKIGDYTNIGFDARSTLQQVIFEMQTEIEVKREELGRKQKKERKCFSS